MMTKPEVEKLSKYVLALLTSYMIQSYNVNDTCTDDDVEPFTTY